MQNLPYIHVIPDVVALLPMEFDANRGVINKARTGEYALWAARVPFLPAMRSDDFAHLGKERLGLIMRRQFRFLYDLARAREQQATFELRFMATPNALPGLPNLIEIVFFGKVFSAQPRAGQALAEDLWRKFASNYPLEDPFNYPLEPVRSAAAFAQLYEPIPFAELDEQHVIEIRKFEEMPVAEGGAFPRMDRKGDYIAHPFVPSVDFSAMGRFLTALAAQPQRCFAGVSLRPTPMFAEEIHLVSAMIQAHKQTLADQSPAITEYYRSRAALGAMIYQQLMQEREQLVMVRIYLVGEHHAPLDLAEAFGSEIVGNVDNRYPTQWSLARPPDAEAAGIAIDNMRYLEQHSWGFTLTEPDMRPLKRLRYFATAQEAFGAFRLPIPPESGHMPGVLVKNEPFVAPSDQLEQRELDRERNGQTPLPSLQPQKRISLGMVYHRGNPTPQEFEVPVRDLTRHALIAGSTGSGKSNTVKHILAQLWARHQIPFLVLYPIDKPDYRELRGYHALAPDLLVFTLGDESTSPFRFNPFEVPAGLLLKTHLSRLMRVFEAAFSLHDPLPMIYREALRKVYAEAGWDVAAGRGQAGRGYPLMGDFYAAIRTVTTGLQYGREVQSNIAQASVIRIGDLLENAGRVLNVRESMSFSHILQQPTVMELGRVGSPQDTALLMGFLLMRFAEELERNRRPTDHPHITVVEEAHRLMAAPQPGANGAGHGNAGEDFSNILAEVRGFGEGLIIAEQIPTLLVKGAIGNTYLKIMHWLEDPESFELFGQIMNLNPAQRDYSRTLTPGFAVVRSPYGQPVHIKIPDVTRSNDYSVEAARYVEDQQISAFMVAQCKRLGIADAPVEAWSGGVQAQQQAQMQPHCPFCQGGSCPVRQQVTQAWAKREQAKEQMFAIYAALKSGHWSDVKQACGAKLRLDQASDAATAYCTIAQKLLMPSARKRQAKALAFLPVYARQLLAFAQHEGITWAVTPGDAWLEQK